MFILWAHVSSVHTELDTDKRSSSYCFICDRSLSKRSQLLKHLDKCAAGNRVINDPTINDLTIEIKLSCEFCDEHITSLSHLETHLFDHVAKNYS